MSVIRDSVAAPAGKKLKDWKPKAGDTFVSTFVRNYFIIVCEPVPSTGGGLLGVGLTDGSVAQPIETFEDLYTPCDIRIERVG